MQPKKARSKQIKKQLINNLETRFNNDVLPRKEFWYGYFLDPNTICLDSNLTKDEKELYEKFKKELKSEYEQLSSIKNSDKKVIEPPKKKKIDHKYNY